MSLQSTIADWGPRWRGSTRALGMIRILVALIVWVRFADEVAFFQAEHPAQIVFGAGLLLFAGLALVGAYTRLSLVMVSMLLAIGYGILGYRLGLSGWYHHHVYLLVATTGLLALSPCDRSFSIDRLRALRAADEGGSPHPAEEGPLWVQRLLGLQLSAVYFWAAVDKTDRAFLSGERLEQTLVWVHSGRPLEALLLAPPMLVLASVAVVLMEYFLAFAIHVRRWHRIVLPSGILLHVGFYLLLPVDTYSGTMIALYLALLSPKAVHLWIDRMLGHAATARHL